MTTVRDRARGDTRLAWMIVGASAAVSLTLIVLLVSALRGPVNRWAEREMQRSQEAMAARQRALAEGGARGRDADVPLDYSSAPPPPRNTARPRGDVAAWIGPVDYPVYALRNADEGRVRVTVAIDPAGLPTGCSVAASSGHWSLDNATCAVMLNKGHFDRARPGVKGVRHWTSPYIRWVLPRS